ncbi:MAG TPA: DUF167 domain-containing protein [Thermomicrobiales bacterium]|nr:DUF167 domain-containing protein [Thermomicrobiales bacterium]HRA48674.1 DUF167 domain-containing protein [Thermomicrobiales bacterium]
MTENSTRITARITPRSSTNRIELGVDGVLLVRITAPPVDNAANQAVVATVAKALHVPKSSVRIVGGEKSRTKILEIDLDLSQIQERLQP